MDVCVVFMIWVVCTRQQRTNKVIVHRERSYCLPSNILRILNDSKAALNVSTVLFPSSTHRVTLALMLPSPRAMPRYTCTHSGSLVAPWVVREAWRTLSYSLFTLRMEVESVGIEGRWKERKSRVSVRVSRRTFPGDKTFRAKCV